MHSSRPALLPHTWARLALGLLALGLLVLGLCAGCGAGSSGHLTASAESLDFGLVAHGEDVTRSLRVRNESRRAVLLTAAIPSCKCLVVEPTYQRSLQPNEETEIHVQLLSGILPGQSQKLEHKHLEVRSDDPEVHVLRVALKGEIEARLTLVPALVRVGPGDAAGRGEPRRLKLRAAKGYQARIVGDVTLTHPSWFTVTQERVPEGIDLLLRVTPEPTRRGDAKASVSVKVEVTGGKLPAQVYDLVVSIQGTW